MYELQDDINVLKGRTAKIHPQLYEKKENLYNVTGAS